MRKRASTSKRQRTDAVPSFGAATEADLASAQFNNPSASASSTRSPGVNSVPPLVTLCARIFVANFLKIRNNERVWHRLSPQIQILPDILIPRLFAMLCSSCPTYLSHELIVTVLILLQLAFNQRLNFLHQFFFRGPSITLQDLPAVKKHTIADIARFNPGVHELVLSGFDKIPDEAFASIMPKLRSLRVLVLR